MRHLSRSDSVIRSGKTRFEKPLDVGPDYVYCGVIIPSFKAPVMLQILVGQDSGSMVPLAGRNGLNSAAVYDGDTKPYAIYLKEAAPFRFLDIEISQSVEEDKKFTITVK